MLNNTTVELQNIDFSKVPLSEVDALIKKAQEYKRQRQTNPVLVKGYVDSVGKHARALLVAVHKLMEAEGVNPQRWIEVEEIMKTLQLDIYKDSAAKVGKELKKASKQ